MLREKQKIWRRLNLLADIILTFAALTIMILLFHPDLSAVSAELIFGITLVRQLVAADGGLVVNVTIAISHTVLINIVVVDVRLSHRVGASEYPGLIDLKKVVIVARVIGLAGQGAQ